MRMASAASGAASFSFLLPRGFLIPRPMGKQIYLVAVSSVPELWRKGPRTVGWCCASSNPFIARTYCSGCSGEVGEEKVDFSTCSRNCSRLCKSLVK